MHGDDLQAGVQQPLDQRPVRALDGDQQDPRARSSLAHSARMPRSSWR
jgi:hypothetical protein